jgi:hypothetical protein
VPYFSRVLCARSGAFFGFQCHSRFGDTDPTFAFKPAKKEVRVKSPTSRKKREKWGTLARNGAPILSLIRCYGVTVSVALVLLVIPPDEALITVVPCATAVAKPPATVAIAVLLELQVALVVMSTTPLHVVAFALNGWVLFVPPTEMDALVGAIAIDWMQPTVTVSGWVPVIAGFCVEVAVMVAVPVLTDFTNPPVEIVATEWVITSEGEPSSMGRRSSSRVARRCASPTPVACGNNKCNSMI